MAPPLAPGAKPTIPGAWPIPSECDSTAAIIAEFYRQWLIEERPKAQALRTAMLGGAIGPLSMNGLATPHLAMAPDVDCHANLSNVVETE